MLSAETITDEHIRELRFSAGRADDIETMNVCDTALSAGITDARRKAARARCAEILNERAKVFPCDACRHRANGISAGKCLHENLSACSDALANEAK